MQTKGKPVMLNINCWTGFVRAYLPAAPLDQAYCTPCLAVAPDCRD